MKHFTTNGREWVAVKVEDKSINHVVKSTSIGKPNQLCYDVVWVAGIYITNQRIVVLPEGEWDVFGLLSQIQNDEDKCAEIIPRHEIPFSEGTFCYQDITVIDGFKAFDTAREAFHSLQQSLKMWTVNPYPAVPENHYHSKDLYEHHKSSYNEAQQHVGEYLILKQV